MEENKAILESLVSNCLRASNADDEEKKTRKKKTVIAWEIFLYIILTVNTN